MPERLTREEAQHQAESIGLPAGPLSYTQMETFLKCQRQYYHRYIAHTEGRFSLVMALGNAMHVGLEIFHKGILADTSDRSPMAVANHLDSGLRALRSAVDLILRNENVERNAIPTIDRQGKCLEELLKLWSREYVPELDITGAEDKFYTVIADTPVNVRIDLLRTSRVSDFKLTKKDKSERDANNSLQLCIYAVATELEDTSFISLKFPVQERMERWEPSITETRAIKRPGDKKWAEEIVGAISKSLSTKVDDRAEYFPPCNPAEWLCSPDYCDYWSKCRGAERKKISMPPWISSVQVGKGWKPY